MTTPVFTVSSRTDSGVEMPDLQLRDEKLFRKFGHDLTANYADIRIHGSKAFFQKTNSSDSVVYSLCACTTGYIWVYVTLKYLATYPRELSDIEVQIGTFALAAKAITTAEVPCRFKLSSKQSDKGKVSTENDLRNGNLALLCSTLIAKYLSLRISGRQFEEATEMAIFETKRAMIGYTVIHPWRYGDFNVFLKNVCANAPLLMLPISDVSIISRGMIITRWRVWREGKVLTGKFRLVGRLRKAVLLADGKGKGKGGEVVDSFGLLSTRGGKGLRRQINDENGDEDRDGDDGDGGIQTDHSIQSAN